MLEVCRVQLRANTPGEVGVRCLPGWWEMLEVLWRGSLGPGWEVQWATGEWSPVVDIIVWRRGMRGSDLCFKYATLDAMWKVGEGGQPR